MKSGVKVSKKRKLEEFESDSNAHLLSSQVKRVKREIKDTPQSVVKEENPITESLQNSADLPLRRVDSVFYKISKEGLPNSYLFGTIHSPVHNIPGLSNFHPELSEGFKNANQIFVEINLNTIDVGQLQGKVLQDILSPTRINEIKDYLKKFDLDKIFLPDGSRCSDAIQLYDSNQEIGKMPSAAVLNIISWVSKFQYFPDLYELINSELSVIKYMNESNKCCYQTKEEQTQNQLDSRLAAIGEQEGKKIISLDSEETCSRLVQLMIPNIDPHEFEEIIVDVLSGRAESFLSEASTSMKDALKENTLYEARESFQEYREMAFRYELQHKQPDTEGLLHEEILSSRNRMWVNAILPHLYIPSFIGVGCLHLFGREGLIKLFEDEGFKVEPQECPRASLPYERQFSKVMDELKSKSALILEHRFLKTVENNSIECCEIKSRPVLQFNKKTSAEELKQSPKEQRSETASISST